ncbi:MAG: serine/threonine-protein kinase, partial [Planctomycetota bacterium]
MEVECPFCRTSQEVQVPRGQVVCTACGETFDVGREEPTVLRDSDEVPEAPQVQRARKQTRAGGGQTVPQWLKEELGDRFEDIRLVGRGGMGAVFKARQKKPSRDVAIKAMLTPHLQSERLVRRFQREAQACAILDHPAIVPIYDYGEVRGHPYFIMEYVEGESLTDWARRHNPGRREICRVMVQVCRALAYAHDQGVVHRDLK